MSVSPTRFFGEFNLKCIWMQFEDLKKSSWKLMHPLPADEYRLGDFLNTLWLLGSALTNTVAPSHMWLLSTFSAWLLENLKLHICLAFMTVLLYIMAQITIALTVKLGSVFQLGRASVRSAESSFLLHSLVTWSRKTRQKVGMEREWSLTTDGFLHQEVCGKG